jgi:hypothetical protein
MMKLPARLTVGIHPNILDIYLLIYLFILKTCDNTIFLKQVPPNMLVCSYRYILTDLLIREFECFGRLTVDNIRPLPI